MIYAQSRTEESDGSVIIVLHVLSSLEVGGILHHIRRADLVIERKRAKSSSFTIIESMMTVHQLSKGR